jgi:hypothetical protein
MRRILVAGLLLVTGLWARSAPKRDALDPLSVFFRHRLHEARRQAQRALSPEQPVEAVLPDAGQIAMIDDSDNVVLAAFDLDQRTLEFKPVAANAAQYTFDVAASRFDAGVLAASTQLSLGDDDSKEVALPFIFPFFGFRYASLFIGSDGHISFGRADDRSWQSGEDPGVRLVAGPPRLAPLYTDLDPSQAGAAISYLSSASRFVISWQNVPVYSPNPGPSVGRQTFQAALYPDGRVEFSYNGIHVAGAPAVAVGIAQGGDINLALYTLVDFAAGSAATFKSTIVEEFINTPQFDIGGVAAKFFRNHEDAYDYLIVLDTVNRGDQIGGACAFSIPVHNWIHGIGLTVSATLPIEEFDLGGTVGASGRFQDLVYLGPLSQYPANPSQMLPSGGICGPNSTLSVLGQESGHRFLAYLQFIDPATGQPSADLLGRDFQHWSFYFNSDASVMEGNQIIDHGAGASPRFETQKINQHYSALDEYAMGLRAASDVPPSFLVRQPSIDFPPDHPPQPGILFNGSRQDITLDMIVAAMGRRAPDVTLSQKRFRFAFALLAPAGTTPSQADIAKADAIRTAWESYFSSITDNRAQADTSLVKQVRLSVWPVSGVIQGHTVSASVALGAPAGAPVTISLNASGPAISIPASVTIPAGAQSASFTIAGNSPGAVEITAQGPDASYETSRAFLLVRPNEAGLTLERVSAALLASGLIAPVTSQTASGGMGPKLDEDLAFRVRDDNYVPYPGLQLASQASGTGVVVNSSLVTDDLGRVRLTWKLGSTPGMNTLTVMLADQPDVSTQVQAIGVPEPAHLRDLR